MVRSPGERTCGRRCATIWARARGRDFGRKKERRFISYRDLAIRQHKQTGRAYIPGSKVRIISNRAARNARRRRFLARCAELRAKLSAGTIQYGDFGRLNFATAALAAQALMTSRHLFTPHEAAKLHGRIGKALAEHFEEAVEAMRGERQWSQAQVRLFTVLMDKVIPNISASHSIVERRTTRVENLSRDDLERIALGLEDTIDIEAVPVPQIERAHDPQQLPPSDRDGRLAGEVRESRPGPGPGVDPA